MAVKNGTSGNDVIDLSTLVLAPGETAHGSAAGAGNDTVYGSAINDLIQGEAGNDLLYGFNGDDGLVGGAGNDTVYGGAGDDSLLTGAGADRLYGGTGNDTMYGGADNDYYYHGLNEGVDVINDDKSEAGNPGYGGGSQDALFLTGISSVNLAYGTGGNDLWFFNISDIADGVVDDGVRIEDFFLGGNNVIEFLVTSDGVTFDLTSLLA